MSTEKKSIFLTGGCGYIGSLLIRKLLNEGYNVKNLDLFIYGDSTVQSLSNNKNFTSIKGDIRDKNILKKHINSSDIIIHLAAIVGDKPCESAPKASYDINFKGTKLLADIAKEKNVKKLIFASTCSNYGISDQNKFATEKSELNPVSLYAESKIDCENLLEKYADKNLNVISLRFGTAYGVSYRTRFDLTVNSFAYEAFKTNKISVFAYDTWRPYIHVDDICNIIIEMVKKKEFNKMSNTFNAGFTHQNFTKKEVVEKLKSILPNLNIEYITLSNDKRNYKVDFSKIDQFLKIKNNFEVLDGFNEVLDALKNKSISDKNYFSNNLEALVKFFKTNKNKLEFKLNEKS